ncbi:hypothetical protein M0R72_12775 [Candidatus Pacearchaeota archaeon]|jgi:hypothetical protein|nr:hypothetical protein [Candidatus Pacearchaeota archaeon]
MIVNVVMIVSVLALLAVGFSLVWPKIRAKVPASVVSTGDKVDLKVDQAETYIAINTAIWNFAEHGSLDTTAKLRAARDEIAGWPIPPPIVVETANTSATVIAPPPGGAT